MKLPNREHAFVSPDKIRDYLLSETHSVGKAKAKFFRSAGFNDTNAEKLKQGLLTIAQSEEVAEAVSSPHGMKYVIEGILQTPRGGSMEIRTIWITEEGQARPRFVTAYPLEKR